MQARVKIRTELKIAWTLHALPNTDTYIYKQSVQALLAWSVWAHIWAKQTLELSRHNGNPKEARLKTKNMNKITEQRDE